MRDIPSLITGLTVVAYWICVARMIVRVSRRTRGPMSVLVPPDRFERRLWIVWIPLVALWIALPFVVRIQDPQRHPLFGLPEAALVGWLVAVRYVATIAGIGCLVASFWCWEHMGRDWRMGVASPDSQRLITDGPYARIRHPIYGLSLVLMTCTVVVAPAPAMLVVGGVHVALLYVKARHEEAALVEAHDGAYEDYRRRTGRFLPRLPRWR